MKSQSFLKWRTFICCTLFLAISHECLCAQKKKIPKKLPVAVISSFQKTYPKAKIYSVNVEQKDTCVYYNIECKDGVAHRNILYAPDGNIFEKRESVSPGSIPENVQTSLESRFRHSKVQSAQKIVRDSTLIGYTIKLTSGKKDYSVNTDSTDTIIKVKEIKRDDY